MTTLREAFDLVLAGRSLSDQQMRGAFDEILDGAPPSPLVAGLLVALRMKGESAGEIAVGVRALLARARPAALDGGTLLDVTGTGGDGKGTFNISTGAALVAAAAGLRIAKSGNRAASGKVGSADVLEHLGVRLEQDGATLRRCLQQAGICFLFAPYYHPAVAQVAALRRELKIRTIFNLLGPLANAAQPSRHVLGVGDPALARPMVQALAELGTQHSMVLHSDDGMDEISALAPTRILEVCAGQAVKEYTVGPQDFGIRAQPGDDITVQDAGHAAEMLRLALGGRTGAAHDVLALNGGAAIYAGGLAASIAQGVQRARSVLREGLALRTLERMRIASHEES